jgi:hypothetical protein
VDGYIASYDKNGNFRWKVIESGTSNDFNLPSGNICTNGTYVWFAGSSNIGGAPQIISPTGAVTIASTGTGIEALVGKLNCSNGGLVWYASYGSAGADQAVGICYDPNGCVYVTGSYTGSFTLNGITASAPSVPSDFYIAKFNPGGGLIHFANGGSTSTDMTGNGGGLCYVPGASPAIVATGNVGAATSAFGGFTGLTNSGGIDAMLVELDTTLNFTNALVFGGSGSDELLSATYDSFSGDVYVCGYYSGSAITFPGTSALPAPGGTDLMLARYSVSANNFVWSKSATGTVNERAWSIAADGWGGILVGGTFNSSPTTFGSLTLTPAGSGDAFVARYNVSGNPVWVLGGGGTGNDEIRGITSYVQTSPSYSQTIITNGLITGITPATFGTTTLIGDGNPDFFMARINDASVPLQATQSQVNLVCNGVATGSATVVASGGTAPYTYSWSPSGGSGATASSLAATTYWCTITDNTSTSITKTFNIIQPSAITSSVISNTPACAGINNGTATITASGGTGSLTYAWAPAGGTGLTASNLSSGAYSVTITDANSCTHVQPVTIASNSATQTGGVAGTAGGGVVSQTYTVGNASGYSVDVNCNRISRLQASGASPASGTVTGKVWVESAVPSFLGHPYVARHYEITPATNASTATGTVTLYFLQSEFDAYNATSALPKLPTGSGDATGIGNLRIEKYPGTSSDNSGLPATYSGTPVLIDPTDVNIIWNGAAGRWEITFDVSGFSGFIVHTSSFTLPISLISFTAARQDDKVLLKWQTASESNNDHFVIEYSADGNNFTAIGTVAAAGNSSNTNNYSFVHAQPRNGANYYRLVSIDINGEKHYSATRRIEFSDKKNGFLILENPVTSGQLQVQFYEPAMATVYNGHGQTIWKQAVTAGSRVIDLSNIAKGIYWLKAGTDVRKFVLY